MKRVKIDTSLIEDWNTFHDVFADAFEFPGFYGRNMDAWSRISSTGNPHLTVCP